MTAREALQRLVDACFTYERATFRTAVHDQYIDALAAAKLVLSQPVEPSRTLPREPTGAMVRAAEQYEAEWKRKAIGEWGLPPVSHIWRTMYDAGMREQK